MKRLLRGLVRPSTFLPVVLLLFVAFIVAGEFIPPNSLALLINGIFISMWIVICATYVPVLTRSLRADHVLLDQYHVSGVLLLWTALAASRFWSIAIILAGKPAWMVNHWFQTFCYLTAALSGFYLLQVPGVAGIGRRKSVIAMLLAVALGTGAIIYLGF